jgi:hypothetical protein
MIDGVMRRRLLRQSGPAAALQRAQICAWRDLKRPRLDGSRDVGNGRASAAKHDLVFRQSGFEGGYLFRHTLAVDLGLLASLLRGGLEIWLFGVRLAVPIQ